MAACAKREDRPSLISYKGIETLLRRIAFNLGNSASQTEVKIISCIPIDVTDLQQKIFHLERQLEQSQGKANRSKAVFPLMVHRTPSRAAVPSSAASGAPEHYTKKPSKAEPTKLGADGRTNDPGKTKAKDLTSYSQPEHKSIFGKQISEKDRTKLVYYAQTATASPFTKYKKATTSKNHNKLNKTMDPQFLTSIIEKQYRSGGMYMEDEALGSQLSAPVCRDVQHCATTSDDMCSCCRGHFLDVDRELHKRHCYAPNTDCSNVYYDSSNYDMKPVKDKPDANKGSDLSRKRGPEIDLAFYPEYYRFNPAEHLTRQGRSKSVNLRKKKERLTRPVILQNDSSQTDGLVEFSRIYARKLSPNRIRGNSPDKFMSRNAQCNARSEINTNNYIGTSKLIQTLSIAKCTSTSAILSKPISASIARATNETERHAVTAKALQTMSLSKLGSTTIHKVTFRNAEVLALGSNETECQTESAKYLQANPPQPDKTESTLEQIKSILQTVLREVKTNSRMSTIVEGKETKDAVVQNEPKTSPDCDRLLGSFTYSGPFAMNNPYVASCSGGVPTYCSSVMRQTVAMPHGPMEISPELKCVQNFPVFVQRTLATQHACCADRAQAKHTSTNTLHEIPQPKKRTTETEHLIKEIYKSMALNVECPTKTTTPEVIDEATSTKTRKTTQNESVGANTLPLGREEIIYRGNVDTSRYTSRMVASHSSHSSLNVRRKRRSDTVHQPVRHITSSAQRRHFNVMEARPRPKEEWPESASDSESESGAVVQPSATPAIIAPNIAKKGFFGKVVSSVMKRMRRKEEDIPQKTGQRMNTIAEDSDSDDPETVQRVEKPVKRVSYAPAQHSPWKSRMQVNNARASTSKTRRHSGMRSPYKSGRSVRHRHDDRMRPSSRMPKYVAPRSAMRPHSGSSQVRRALHGPSAPPRPRTPPEYMRRVPYNQYEWRTTPHTFADAALGTGSHDHKPKTYAGIKITNKAWMRKPVHHLGFACGPEKTKILMQRY